MQPGDAKSPWARDGGTVCEGERRARIVPFVGTEAENTTAGMIDEWHGPCGGLERVREL
jgi:hypothetical protein